MPHRMFLPCSTFYLDMGVPERKALRRGEMGVCAWIVESIPSCLPDHPPGTTTWNSSMSEHGQSMQYAVIGCSVGGVGGRGLGSGGWGKVTQEAGYSMCHTRPPVVC